MVATDQHVRALAARIRLHFEPRLQDIAEEFALLIAQTAGASVKLLRPDTVLDDILAWIGTDSLDRVEVMMAIEEELGFEIPDPQAERSDRTTFRDLVLSIAKKRGVI